MLSARSNRGRHRKRPSGRRRALRLIAVAALATSATGGIVAAHRFGPDAVVETKVEVPLAEAAGGASSAEAASVAGATAADPPNVPTTARRHAHSPNRASSLWVVVNKDRPLSPVTYAPELTVVAGKEVAAVMADDLGRMLAAADRAGAGLKLVSGYRSHARQQQIYAQQVARQGSPAAADRLSARPGHSEHQTGLAVDVDSAESSRCQLHRCFSDTAAGRWVAQNAERYGFVVRYTAANAAITGYSAEPWHLRYVGTALIRKMAAAKAESLEEYFGLDGRAAR